MQAHILCSRQTLASAALFASVAFTPATLWAQGASGNVPNDYYRAELVILQRLVDPAGIEEQMAKLNGAKTATVCMVCVWIVSRR